VKTWSTEGAVWGPASSLRVPPAAEKLDPGWWWVPEGVGCHLQTGDLPKFDYRAWKMEVCVKVITPFIIVNPASESAFYFLNVTTWNTAYLTYT
jgi:hypothetical protein